jgi:hypothetical protein
MLNQTKNKMAFNKELIPVEDADYYFSRLEAKKYTLFSNSSSEIKNVPASYRVFQEDDYLKEYSKNNENKKISKENDFFKNPTLIDVQEINKSQRAIFSFEPDSLYAPGTVNIQPEPFVASGSKWSQPGGKNTIATITYSLSGLLNGVLIGGLTNSQITSIVREAVGLYSKYAPLNFVEIPDSGPAFSDTFYNSGTTPQIRFGVHSIDGVNNVLAHGYYPSSATDGLAGDIHFDSSETWKANPSSGGFDLLEVAVHELGHALGLNHETTQTAIMNPIYGGRYSGIGSAFLFQDDINGIRDIYGTKDLFNIQRWATKQGGFWDAQQWLTGDFNGDGKTDVAKAFNDGGLGSVDVHVSNGSSFTMQRWATKQGGFWDAQQWLTGDFNGDGKTDVAKAFNDGGLGSVDVHVSNGSGFTMQRWATKQGGFWDTQQWLTGDFNGDGKTDVAKAFNDGGLGSVDVHVSNGSGFTMQRWATKQGGFWDTQKWLTGDFNGDGKTDICKIFNDGGLASIDVHISNGSGFTMQRWATKQGGFWDTQQWVAGDFNGDGKTDLAKSFNDAGLADIDVHLSTGSGFGIQRWATQQGGFWDKQQWLAGDFNGDGKTDLSKAFNDNGLGSIDVHRLT